MKSNIRALILSLIAANFSGCGESNPHRQVRNDAPVHGHEHLRDIRPVLQRNRVAIKDQPRAERL